MSIKIIQIRLKPRHFSPRPEVNREPNTPDNTKPEPGTNRPPDKPEPDTKRPPDKPEPRKITKVTKLTRRVINNTRLNNNKLREFLCPENDKLNREVTREIPELRNLRIMEVYREAILEDKADIVDKVRDKISRFWENEVMIL